MPETRSRLSSLMTPARIVAAVLAALAIVFVLQNRASTSISLFWLEVQAPMWFTLLIVFVVGWLVGMLVSRRRSVAK